MTELEELRHYKDTTIGLWATDKPSVIPKKSMKYFWKLKDKTMKCTVKKCTVKNWVCKWYKYKEICEEVKERFNCTRPKGHEGEHIACGTHNDIVGFDCGNTFPTTH